MNLSERRIILYTALFIFVLFFLILFEEVDLRIILSFTSLRNPFLDQIMWWISNAGSGILIFFVMSALFLYEERKRKWIIPLWLGFALSTLLVFLLKILILRERPFMLLDMGSSREFAWWDSSFPSWNAAMAFSALPVLDKEFPRIKFFWIVFAILVLFSRMYFAYHFLSDVLGGALVGYFSGLFFLKIWEGHKMKVPRRK